MKCNQCGAEFEGKFCPECGSPAATVQKADAPQAETAIPQQPVNLSQQSVTSPPLGSNKPVKKTKKPFYKKWWFFAIIAIAVVIIGVVVFKSVTETSKPAESHNTSDELRNDFKEAMDNYEKFMDEYVSFMKKYKESNGTDLGLLVDLAKYTSKYADMVEQFDKWEGEDLNAAEIAYYIEVQARVSKKLLEVAG